MTQDKKASRVLPVVHVIMLLAGLALIGWRDYTDAGKGIRITPTLEEVKKAFTGETNAHLVTEPIPHYLGTMEGAGKTSKAAAVATAMLDPKVRGYVDQVNVLVVVDESGVVRSVKMLDNRETPEYMRRVMDAGFLDSFTGKNAKGGFKDIDTVTGASITSRAILDDVSAAAALAGSRIFGLSIPAPKVATWTGAFRDPRLIALLIGMVIALYGRFGTWPRRYRLYIVRVSSLVLIGIYAMTPYTLVHTFQLLKLDLPGPGNATLAVLGLFVVATTLLFGPLWCGYACPFGALQELLAKAPLRHWKVTPKLMRYAREARFLLLFITVVGAFGLGVHAFAEVEPFGHLFGRTREPLAWAFILAVLVASLFVKRFWCRFFCPTGACLVILSSHRKYLRSVARGVDDAGIDKPDVDEPVEGE